MTETTNYTDYFGDEDMPIGELTVVPDFLPPPAQLVFKVPRDKITIEVHKPILGFYKAEAEKLGIPYSQLIRAVLSEYAKRMQGQNK
jgi:hypothetical protein